MDKEELEASIKKHRAVVVDSRAKIEIARQRKAQIDERVRQVKRGW